MEAFYRALTGQTLSARELKIGACLIIIWFLMDVIQFADWLYGKMQ